MADEWSTHSTGIDGPANNAAAVTPDNDNDLANAARALYIGGAGSGNLSVITVGGQTVAFAGLSAGTILPVRVARVRSTGTDVTSVVALW